MNRVDIVGRVVRDIEVRYTQSGHAVTGFTVAVSRRKKVDGADFITCVAWGKTAELMGQYVKKGDRIGVSGRIQTGSYEKDGVTHYTTDVYADEVEFLEPKRAEKKEAEPTELTPEELGFYAVEDGDLPF